MKKFFTFLSIVLLGATLHAQFAINLDGSKAHPYAALELESTTQGFLAPRMLEADIPGSPAAGLIIYQTDGDFPGFYQYIGSEWIPLRHNAFKGFVQGATSNPSNFPVTGSLLGAVATDGDNMIIDILNTGTYGFDLSAYSFTGTPVVTTTSRFDIIESPMLCNGDWGDGNTDQDHLHKLFLAAQSNLGSPFIYFETDLDPSFGINNAAFGADRALGYDYLTSSDTPPGRHTYYDFELYGTAGDPSTWDNAGDGNDQFPHPTASTWTTGGVNEVYNLTPMVAGDVYQIQVQPFNNPPVEAGSAFHAQVNIYIDYNIDGDFDDASETIYQYTQDTWLTAEVVNFIVPTSALNDTTVMRVVVQRASNFAGSGQTGANPDLSEGCLANFLDDYTGHTTEFDLLITGGSSPFIYEGTFCNVSEPNPSGFIVRCYDQDGILKDMDFDFNVYEKF